MDRYFTRKVYVDIVIDSLKYCQANKGLKIHAWCIMSNHLHLIVSTDENNKLSDVIRDFKKFTSVSILAELKTGKNFEICRENPRVIHYQD